MFSNKLKNYLERLWEIYFKFQLQTFATKIMISLSQITYYAYFDDYSISLKEYSCHVNIIFLFTWKIFGLCGRIFFKDYMLLTKNQLTAHVYAFTR
jgi:hypothetical protein